MTHDELVGKVARAICCEHGCCAPSDADCNRRVFNDSARAAIAVVIEECAQVAEEHQRDYSVSDCCDTAYEMALTDAAAAIRKLGDTR